MHPEHWIALASVPEIGPVTFRKLLTVYGEPEAVFRAGERELSAIEGVGSKKAKNIRNFSDWHTIGKQVGILEKVKARLITFRDQEYPILLRHSENSPPLIYLKGTVHEEDRFALAIVGSRRPSHYGKVVAERFARDLSGAGFLIVSGMARGIDTIAHTETLRSGGRTAAVLGSGIDRPYPAENHDLMEKIAAAGFVISEFPVGCEPRPENFPRRNTIISGLSLGVLVVEASAGSGALITARSSVEQNREVFAIPGNITSPLSEGTNELIKQGAKLVQKTEDVIEELGAQMKGLIRQQKRPTVEMTDEEKKLCDILHTVPTHIDKLSRELSLPAAKTLALLSGLEMKGLVRQAEGKRFYLVTT